MAVSTALSISAISRACVARAASSSRVAIVTGATAGVGRAIAHRFARAGFHIGLIARDEGALAEVEQEIQQLGGEAIGVPADVADFEACGVAVAQITEKYGPISVLVNNAGITRDNAFRNLSVEDWQSVINTNLGGVFNLCRLVFPEMVKAGYGRIINISSVNGLCGQYGQANYTAAKSGMVGFTKTLALEGAKYGVTANVLAPATLTDLGAGACFNDARVQVARRA